MLLPLAVAFAFVTMQPALAEIDDCGSREFRQAFLAGSPMDPSGEIVIDYSSPDPRLVKAGDRVLPCLAAIVVEGTGEGLPECRKEPRLCWSWAMGAVTQIGTPRAAGFLLSVAGSTDDPDRLIGAAGSLASMHVREAIPILLARLDSGEGRVRARLVMSLGILKARDCTPELVRTTLGLKPEDFYYAIHGFGFLGDPSVVPALRKYVDAMPATDMRKSLTAQVNDIAVVANFQAGMEQKNGGVLPWAESFLRAAIAEGEKTGSASPTLAEADYELGDMCRRGGRWDEAETLLAQAADLMPKFLSLNGGKRLDVDIAGALTRDARGANPELARKFSYFARVLHAARPERKKEIWDRFPELRDAFTRYESYCRANKLQACQQDLSEYITR